MPLRIRPADFPGFGVHGIANLRSRSISGIPTSSRLLLSRKRDCEIRNRLGILAFPCSAL
jgi:hypothetical protein